MDDRQETIAALHKAQRESRIYGSTLRHISQLVTEWQANNLGSLAHQKRRWLALGTLADEALKDAQSPKTD